MAPATPELQATWAPFLLSLGVQCPLCLGRHLPRWHGSPAHFSVRCPRLSELQEPGVRAHLSFSAVSTAPGRGYRKHQGASLNRSSAEVAGQAHTPIAQGSSGPVPPCEVAASLGAGMRAECPLPASLCPGPAPVLGSCRGELTARSGPPSCFYSDLSQQQAVPSPIQMNTAHPSLKFSSKGGSGGMGLGQRDQWQGWHSLPRHCLGDGEGLPGRGFREGTRSIFRKWPLTPGPVQPWALCPGRTSLDQSRRL